MLLLLVSGMSVAMGVERAPGYAFTLERSWHGDSDWKAQCFADGQLAYSFDFSTGQGIPYGIVVLETTSNKSGTASQWGPFPIESTWQTVAESFDLQTGETLRLVIQLPPTGLEQEGSAPSPYPGSAGDVLLPATYQLVRLDSSGRELAWYDTGVRAVVDAQGAPWEVTLIRHGNKVEWSGKPKAGIQPLFRWMYDLSAKFTTDRYALLGNADPAYRYGRDAAGIYRRIPTEDLQMTSPSGRYALYNTEWVDEGIGVTGKYYLEDKQAGSMQYLSTWVAGFYIRIPQVYFTGDDRLVISTFQSLELFRPSPQGGMEVCPVELAVGKEIDRFVEATRVDDKSGQLLVLYYEERPGRQVRPLVPPLEWVYRAQNCNYQLATFDWEGQLLETKDTGIPLHLTDTRTLATSITLTPDSRILKVELRHDNGTLVDTIQIVR